MDVPIKNYSSGMHMRLGFAIAANLNPNIMLLDEIFAVGDEEFQRQCMATLEEFLASGRTIVFVSHLAAAVQAISAGCACSIGARCATTARSTKDWPIPAAQFAIASPGARGIVGVGTAGDRCGVAPAIERWSLGGDGRVGVRLPPPSRSGAVEIRPRSRLRQSCLRRPPPAVHGTEPLLGI